jgi:hypothetical protein
VETKVKSFRTLAIVVSLTTLTCWGGGMSPARAAVPAVLGSVLDLNHLLDQMMKDVIDRGQKQSPANQQQPGHTNDNHSEYHIVVVTNHPAIPAAAAIPRRNLPATFRLPAAVEWFDTGIVLSKGETVTIQASGDIYVGSMPDMKLNHETPDGAPIMTTGDPQFSVPFLAEGLVPWSLVGKIGDAGQPFEVGSQDIFASQFAGELYLSVNDNNFGDNSGNWEITIFEGNIYAPTVPATNSIAALGTMPLFIKTNALPTNSPLPTIAATNSIVTPSALP